MSRSRSPAKRSFGGLARPRDDRVVAGVLSGIARRFGMKSTTVRVLFVVSCLLPGPQFVAYLVFWVLIPSEP